MHAGDGGWWFLCRSFLQNRSETHPFLFHTIYPIIIIIADNQIGGSLPSEIGRLSDLENFAIWANALTGTIPTEFGQLSRLTYLDFGKSML
jgi:hypothetical protein